MLLLFPTLQGIKVFKKYTTSWQSYTWFRS